MGALRRQRGRRRTVVLTPGSVRNSHLPLTGILEFFPTDAVGGRSAQQAARRRVFLSFGLSDTVETDIVEGKQVFRRRGWVREFLRAHRLKAGDRVVIEEVAPYRYHLYPEPAAGDVPIAEPAETKLAIELEQEQDGRWIGEVTDL